jgi:para-aminobenzoate synthetase component 1
MAKPFPYTLLNGAQVREQINRLAALRIPFLFIIDYRAESGYVIPEIDLDERFVRFEVEEQRTKNKDQREFESILEKENTERLSTEQNETQWQIEPVPFELYKSKFDFVQAQIQKGNSFLVNLTQPSEVKTNLSLLDLFEKRSAKYKLWLKDKFTVLSPETFVQIRNGKIASFPMKGTIDASLPNAESCILNDQKEKAEHATIVDLIRNDLSMVAKNVEVTRYRYIDKLVTNKGDLLQVSSEITGDLPISHFEKLGDILFALLLPFYCGAPKRKTLEVIEKAEWLRTWFLYRNLRFSMAKRSISCYDSVY